MQVCSVVDSCILFPRGSCDGFYIITRENKNVKRKIPDLFYQLGLVEKQLHNYNSIIDNIAVLLVSKTKFGRANPLYEAFP